MDVMDDERRELDATEHPGMIREGGRASCGLVGFVT